MSSVRRHFQGKGKYFYGSGAITVTEIVPEGYADYDISDDNAAVGDVISVSLAEADMEAVAMIVSGSWVAEAGVITVRIYNGTANGGANLTGGAAVVYYTIKN